MPISAEARIQQIAVDTRNKGMIQSADEMATELEYLFNLYGLNHEEISKIIAQNIQKKYSEIVSAINVTTERELAKTKKIARDVESRKTEVEKALIEAQTKLQNAKVQTSITEDYVLQAERMYLEAVEENYKSGMEKTLLEGTSSYLSYVVINNPAEVDTPTPGDQTGDGRSPLKRYKDSRDMLTDRIQQAGILTFDFGTPWRELFYFNPSITIINDYPQTFVPTDYTNGLSVSTGSTYTLPAGYRDFIISTFQQELDSVQLAVRKLMQSYGLTEFQAAPVIAQLQYAKDSAISGIMAQMSSVLTAIELEEIGLNNQIEIFLVEVLKAEKDVREISRKISAIYLTAKKNIAKARSKKEDARNFYFSLMRSNLSTAQNYASSVVSAVPEKGQAVIDDLKQALNDIEEAISER